MLGMWQMLFDILFPLTPSEQKVRALTRLTLDPKQVHTASGRKVLTCVHYQDKNVREAIALLKKQGDMLICLGCCSIRQRVSWQELNL